MKKDKILVSTTRKTDYFSLYRHFSKKHEILENTYLNKAVHLPIPNFITPTLSIFISRSDQPGDKQMFHKLSDYPTFCFLQFSLLKFAIIYFENYI